MKKHIINIVLVLLFISCKKETNQTIQLSDNEPNTDIVSLTNEQISNANIEISKAEKKPLTETIEVNGILDVPPRNLVSITAILGGYVRDVTVLQGMNVHKGHILAVLENPDFLSIQQEYLESLAKLEFLIADYERQKELNSSDIGSKRDLQETQSNFTVIEAKTKSLSEKIKMLNLPVSKLNSSNISSKINILSPIKGYVTAVNVNMGSFIAPQNVMFEIADTDHLHAELYVYEKDIAKLAVGQKVSIVLANDPSKNYQGTVYLVNKKIEADRTVRVHVHFSKHDESMIPGMYIKAFIAINTEIEWTIPEQAFVSFDDKKYVFVEIKVGCYRMTEVNKGRTQNGFSQINLRDNTHIGSLNFVTNGAFTLLGKIKNAVEE
ncbi:MAG: efflux RND transporter periplasmic adaptor subunit [Cytophagales bacterium]